MANRPTLTDVAEAAGVSTATVDRVINSRLPVKEGTALRVLEAAERIGYHAVGLMRQRLQRGAPSRRLAICLQRSDSVFYRSLAQDFVEAAQHLSAQGDVRCAVQVTFLDVFEPAAIAEQMLSVAQHAEGLAVVAVDHPHISEAVAALHQQGKPTVALLSDISAPLRLGYVGNDNRQRGRIAAWAIKRLARRGGPVGILVGSHRYLGHEEGEMAFRAALRESQLDFQVLDAQVTLEDEPLIYEATRSLLTHHPDLVGLFKVGGNSKGMVQALKEGPRPPELVTVSLELNPDNRIALIDGTIDLILNTPRREVAETALTVLLRALQPDYTPAYGQQFILPFGLHTQENPG